MRVLLPFAKVGTMDSSPTQIHIPSLLRLHHHPSQADLTGRCLLLVLCSPLIAVLLPASSAYTRRRKAMYLMCLRSDASYALKEWPWDCKKHFQEVFKVYCTNTIDVFVNIMFCSLQRKRTRLCRVLNWSSKLLSGMLYTCPHAWRACKSWTR